MDPSTVISGDNSLFASVYAQIMRPGKVEDSLHVARLVAEMQRPITKTDGPPPIAASATEPAPLSPSQRPTRPYALPATEPCAPAIGGA